MAKIDSFFNLMFEQKASDLHLSAGNNPMLRINGELQRVEHPPLENDALKSMLYEIAPEYKIKIFEETGDVDFVLPLDEIAAKLIELVAALGGQQGVPPRRRQLCPAPQRAVPSVCGGLRPVRRRQQVLPAH